MKLNWNFQGSFFILFRGGGGGGLFKPKTSNGGGLDIFWKNRDCKTAYGRFCTQALLSLFRLQFSSPCFSYHHFFQWTYATKNVLFYSLGITCFFLMLFGDEYLYSDNLSYLMMHLYCKGTSQVDQLLEVNILQQKLPSV